MIPANRTYQIAWVRMIQGEYKTRLLKITYNKTWKNFNYKIYEGTLLHGVAKTKEESHKILIDMILYYMKNGWSIEFGNFNKFLFL